MTRDEHWNLWRRDPRATPFQSSAWIEAWWRHWGGGERIDAEARDGAGRLIGALPMTVWRDGAVRRLVPVAAGQSDYADALIDPAAADAAVAGLWAALAETEWDELLLPDLRPDSPMRGALPPGWRAHEEPGEICPVLALPADVDLLAGLTKTQRRKVVHDRHRAAALGGVTEALAAPAEIDEALDALFALHAARWARECEPGVLADPRMQAFLRDAAHGLAEAGLLALSVVRHHGRIVAALLGFIDARRGYSYINGVDMAVPKQSFGTLAFATLIEAAQARGAREFHFLRGEEPYKYAWGAEPTHTIRRVIRRAR